MHNILFLCTGNSCRSQMAEGFTRAIADERAVVASAGIEAHGQNPRAVAVMREAGIEISNQQSTQVDEDMLAAADLVVTVCGHADEHCPMLPAGVRRIHWPLPDPARASGSESEIMAQFRTVRDDIRGRVEKLLETELELK